MRYCLELASVFPMKDYELNVNSLLSVLIGVSMQRKCLISLSNSLRKTFNEYEWRTNKLNYSMAVPPWCSSRSQEHFQVGLDKHFANVFSSIAQTEYEHNCDCSLLFTCPPFVEHLCHPTLHKSTHFLFTEVEASHQKTSGSEFWELGAEIPS